MYILVSRRKYPPPNRNPVLIQLQVSLADVVQLHPSTFNRSPSRGIEDFLNRKYANKILHNVGLCLGFHSLLRTSEGLISHGTGLVNVNVDFRMIVYRPFKGEIINATITHSHPQRLSSGRREPVSDGEIVLSQDFFEDISVPAHLLFDRTEWGVDEYGTEAYIWYYKDENDAEAEASQFYFDRAEKCLVRVEDEQWHDFSPQRRSAGQKDTFVTDEEVEDGGVRKIPYLVRGSMMLGGLGPMLWWIGEEQLGGPVEESVENGDAKVMAEP